MKFGLKCYKNLSREENGRLRQKQNITFFIPISAVSSTPQTVKHTQRLLFIGNLMTSWGPFYKAVGQRALPLGNELKHCLFWHQVKATTV
jgi:hypothetical protein